MQERLGGRAARVSSASVRRVFLRWASLKVGASLARVKGEGGAREILSPLFLSSIRDSFLSSLPLSEGGGGGATRAERDWSGTTLATAKDFETWEERRERQEGSARPTKDEGVSFSAQNCN